MARCANDAKFNRMAYKKLENKTEIYFDVRMNPERCELINTRDYIELHGDTGVYNRYLIPGDAFDCLPQECVNTGTLMVTSDLEEENPGATFRVDSDATEFYGGAMTYYVWVPEAGTYDVMTKIYDVADAGATTKNADTYVSIITATDAGFYPVLIDFSIEPAMTTGSGWIASTAGAIVNVSVGNGEAEGNLTIGLSTFYFYDSIEYLENNSMVVLSCPTDIASDFTVDAIDATCVDAGYDASSAASDITITANAITPNHGLLNPAEGRGETRDGFFIAKDERVVQRTTEFGGVYGYIQIADWNEEECGFVQLGIDTCRVFDSLFRRVMSPVPVSLDPRQFIVIGSEQNPLKKGTILVDESLIGETVIVYYAKRQQVRAYEAKEENIGKKQVRAFWEFCVTDREFEAYLWNNLLVTSFSMLNVTSTDQPQITITLSPQLDKNGVWYTRYEAER